MNDDIWNELLDTPDEFLEGFFDDDPAGAIE